MAISPTTPLTGSAITGLTSPTYTLSADSSDAFAKQWAVTALGGTQTGVITHSPDLPFTLTFKRPKSFKTLGVKNAITGQYSTVGMNEFKTIIRKAVAIQSGQYGVAVVEINVRLPAGSASHDAANIKALASASGGFVANQIQGICDTVLTGVM